MKKLFFIALLNIMFTHEVSAQNFVNPFYMPSGGDFYAQSYMTKSDDVLSATQKFGYGITNRVELSGGVTYDDKDTGANGFGRYFIGLKGRFLNNGLIGDGYFKYSHHLDQDVLGEFSAYTLGTKIGETIGDLTFAGTLEYTYWDSKGDNNINYYMIGGETFYKFNRHLSGSINLDYHMDDIRGNDDTLFLTTQLNFGIRVLLSVYYSKDIINSDDMFGIKYSVGL